MRRRRKAAYSLKTLSTAPSICKAFVAPLTLEMDEPGRRDYSCNHEMVVIGYSCSSWPALPAAGVLCRSPFFPLENVVVEPQEPHEGSY